MGWPTRSRWWLRLASGWWRLAVLGAGFVVLVWGVSYFLLVPAMDSLSDADPQERRMLRAVSALLLAVVLLILTLATVWAVRRK